MNIFKRIKSIMYYRIWQPVYSKTIGLSKKAKKVRLKYHMQKGKRNIVILGTPNHGNLGDYAIGVAEAELFQRHCPDCNIFDVDLTDFPQEIKALHKILSANDILVLTGGGNLGNQYMDDERVRRDTIRMFPHNQIIMFPQTIFFTPDETGKEEELITKEIYNKHKHLTLMARDEYSYKRMREIFTVPVLAMPDVVLTMRRTADRKREGALLLLRTDVERKYTDEQEQMIEAALRSRYERITRTDTEIPVEEFLQDKKGTLESKILQIAQARLVVTDRLHGMIFAAITGTPCVALDNYNHKVRETCKWVAHLPYIRYVTDLQELDTAVQELSEMKKCTYDGQLIDEKYEKFMQETING